MKTTFTIIAMVITLIIAIAHPQVAWLCLLFWMIFLACILCPIHTNHIPQYKRNTKYDWYLESTGEYVQYWR